jgi:hypothetical protein
MNPLTGTSISLAILNLGSLGRRHLQLAVSQVPFPSSSAVRKRPILIGVIGGCRGLCCPATPMQSSQRAIPDHRPLELTKHTQHP